ncbi:uncharacterized protein LOC120422760 [Culex pipiens pallens]|uniref:uncharacterized protein LOC120422760 n=1 Tax=Culex pipiens pallens TaxID=42434 RepID=UPI0022AA4E3F|nr:uncharacterized protein LOC120422760 [Culex pipiens pallens]XP_052563457.1 uncharacterized protein LOC120422760 [Culex pipiens pallens]
MMLHEEVELDDTHLCNKCGRTVVGLENYIKHRKANCVQSKPATVIAGGSSSRIGSVHGYGSFDFGEGIKDTDHHKKLPNYSFNYDLEAPHADPVQRPDSKTEYKNEVNYDYELGADLFFSSLELQSSSKKNLNTSASKISVPSRPKSRKPTSSLSTTDPDQEHEQEDDWIDPHHDSDKLMKAVSDISGNKREDSIYTFFHHESPEPSDEESDEEEDFDAPPRTHTGGKWKPENRPSSSQWRHWPDQEGQLDKSIEHEEEEEYKSFSPPPGHTKGKWVPGSKITRLEYKTPTVPSKSFDTTYWCSICNRKLASRFVYERHLKSNLHIKRAQEESELERAVKPTQYPNELSKRVVKPSVYLGDDFLTTSLAPEQTSTPTKLKRKRKCYYTKCEICKTRLPTHLLGKHLISRYHYRRMLNHPGQCFDVILKNVHRIVLQSPFQCHPCKFYANNQEQFMTHWNSLGHEQQVSSSGKFWCSFCKFECIENFQMTNHLLGPDHQEVISVINRSVPIIIRKITPITCFFCGDEFRYNVQLQKHHEFCNEGTPEDTNRVKRSFQNAFSCDLCKASFHNKMLLLQHGQKLHRLTTYYCSICELSFNTPAESKLHRQTTAHKVMSARKRKTLNPSGKRCHICKQYLADILELKHHIRQDHPEVKYSCPQCGQSFVLAQELGRHVRDKNCTFFNSPALQQPETEPLPSSSTAAAGKAVPSTARAHLPGENSIILNDSIKVNMNDHKIGKESHLYSSAPVTGTMMVRRTVLVGGRTETVSRAPTLVEAVEAGNTADESSGALSTMPAMTMMDHYTNLLPTIPSEPSEPTTTLVLSTTVATVAEKPESTPEIETHHLAGNTVTTTTTTITTFDPASSSTMITSASNSTCDDNIVTTSVGAVSTSAEIFFAMANNASENNTVYVDEIVGTITDDGSDISWQCKICPFRTSSQAEFLYHGILHSSKVDTASTVKIPCSLCRKPFRRASLRAHLRQHTNERIFPCELCPMSFTRKANLKNHVDNIHAAVRLESEMTIDDVPVIERKFFVCETCGKAFGNSNLLLQHTRVHLRDRSIKEFACQHAGCFYVGRSAAEVRTHLASRHSDERNFVCVEPDCDYRGKTITQLRR